MKEFFLRYQRQIILEGFGNEAQQKLSKARVLVIGAGGLGCPVLQYLAAAGVGCLGIADDDVVDISNLPRQILYGQADVGKKKVEVIAERIMAMNHLVQIITYPIRFKQTDCITHFPSYDVIVDATDNFPSRYLLNDGCVLLDKPMVYGAVSRFEGQVAVCNVPKNGGSLNYRDIFPEMPSADSVLNCGEAGVLGVLPGIIGLMQATEVIKLITGIGEVLSDQLLTFNALSMEMIKIKRTKQSAASLSIPATIDEYIRFNYEITC